jgi:glycosyltransferase involved in cell wall biosynthesis
MKRISVVIPTFNEDKGLDRFLRQFDRQTLPRELFELIIVDGNSTDKTRDIAKEYADKVILQESEGIGGARNDGVLAAKAPIVATTDADVKLPRIWLERILDDFRDSGVVAVCGPDGPMEETLKSRLVFFLLKNIIYLGSKMGIYCTGGGNSAFRKDIFLEIGGYKPLPHSDDVEIAFRIKEHGRIVYDKDLFVRISTRRMETDGYLPTLLTWLKGDLLVFLGKPIPQKSYAKKDY